MEIEICGHAIALAKFEYAQEDYLPFIGINLGNFTSPFFGDSASFQKAEIYTVSRSIILAKLKF